MKFQWHMWFQFAGAHLVVCNILKTSASFFILRVSKHETSEESTSHGVSWYGKPWWYAKHERDKARGFFLNGWAIRHEMNRIFTLIFRFCKPIFFSCFSHVVDQVRFDLHNGVSFPVYLFAGRNMLTVNHLINAHLRINASYPINAPPPPPPPSRGVNFALDTH